MTRRDFADKLNGMDVEASEDEIQSSARATALYLKAHAAPGTPVYVLGERGIRDELRAAGLCPLYGAEWRGAQFVAVGMDRRFTYGKLAAALDAIVIGGAQLIATNRDPSFPLEGGRIVPGGGSMVSAIETAAGREALLIGKPQPYMLDQILAETGVKPARALMVGDRATTDVLAGRNAGMETLLVLGGVTPKSDIAGLPVKQRPHFIAKDIRGVLSVLGLSSKHPTAAWKDFAPAAAGKKRG